MCLLSLTHAYVAWFERINRHYNLVLNLNNFTHRVSMNKHFVDKSGEVRELSPKDMLAFKPARDVLPAALQKTLGVKTRGPQSY